MQVNVELALHCLSTNFSKACPIVKERGMVGQPLRDSDPLCAGKSITGQFHEQLDIVMDMLLDDHKLSGKKRAAWKARGQAICEMLATLANPYRPDVEAFKEMALERYYERNPPEPE